MIPCQELKGKRKIRVKNLLRKQYVSKQSIELYEYKIAKSCSPSMSWKLNISLTQKDTMDRGAWIKKFRKKGMQEDILIKKKVQNGMGMRNKWIFMFTICYDPVVSKLEATRRQRKKWNSFSSPWKSYLDFEILVSFFLDWTTLND